ncbi:MAG: hypothetical protein EON93_24045, partial [Burkholderiales bacterium]
MVIHNKAAGQPVLMHAEGSVPLVRVQLGAGTKSEAWLQELLFGNPELVPASKIEPAFGTLVAAACEIPCASGYIDNVYVTPEGDIVLLEAKLWKNPEARRELVAQALDYVAALTGMTYAEFEQALRKGKPTNVHGSLYDVVRDHPTALSEAAFIDALSLNLKRGRMLVLGVGDGIRSEARALAALLQSHAGAHFTFALVEMGIWQNPLNGELLCVPDTLAQTVMIERGIVTIENGAIVVKPVTPGSTPLSKAHTLSEADFLACRAVRLVPERPIVLSHCRAFDLQMPRRPRFRRCRDQPGCDCLHAPSSRLDPIPGDDHYVPVPRVRLSPPASAP